MTKNKVIVLTGASGGIGRAIAHELAEAGHTLVLVGSDPNGLHALKSALGKRHYCVTIDLTTEQGLSTLVSSCAQMDAGIDALINCAGMSDFSLLENVNSDKIQKMVAINLTAPILLCQALLPLLKKKGHAQIINIGSTFGSIGYPGFSTYSATKFGLRGFTESLRRELADTAIEVRYFAPRATQTTINTDKVVSMNNEIGTTMDTPEQVAQTFIKFFNHQGLHSCFVGWPEKLFVKINSVLPSLVDNSILKQLTIIKRYL